MDKLTNMLGGVSWLLGVLYPVVVFVGLTYFSPAHCIMGVLALLACRLIVGVAANDPDARRWRLVGLVVVAGAMVGVYGLGRAELGLRLMPAMINATFLIFFGVSLWSVPIIERIARRFDPDLTPPRRAHCRQFTRLWCVFFAANTALCAAMAVWAPRGWWAAYTGGISYGLMGGLFMLEFLVRRYRFRQFSDVFADRWLEGVLPNPTPIDVTQ